VKFLSLEQNLILSLIYRKQIVASGTQIKLGLIVISLTNIV